MYRFLQNLFGQKTPRNSSPKRSRKRVLLQIEALEDRLMPVVGANFIPDQISTGVQNNPAYNGVVALTSVGWGTQTSGTGTLLYGGQYLLTAAHVVTQEDGSGRVDPKGFTRVYIDTRDGTFSFDVTASNYHIVPGYDGQVGDGHDLALIALPQAAQNKVPYGTSLFDVYANTDEEGKVFLLAGYGRTGTGATGELDNTYGYKRVGFNRFDLAKEPYRTTQNVLAYDFDSGNPADDTLGRDANVHDLGLGPAQGSFQEACSSHGDSGGPTFVDGAIAGVVSYTEDFKDGALRSRSGFGAVGVVTRVSAYANWINGFIGPGINRPNGRSYTLDLTGKANANVELRMHATYVDFVVNGTTVHSDYLVGLDSITIKGGSNTNSVIPPTLAGKVHFQGASGSNSLVLDDHSFFDPQERTAYTITSTGIWRAGVSLLPADYSGIQNITLRVNDIGSSIVVHDTPNTAVALDTGAGNDNIVVESTSAPLSIISHGGQDTVTVGLNNSLAGIRYSLGVSNDAGSTQLNLLAGGDNWDHAVEIGTAGDWGDYVTGLAPAPILFGHTGIAGVHITTGSGADSFNIKYAEVPMNIETGAGADSVSVVSNTASAPLYLDLGQDRNLVTVGGQYGLGAIQGQIQIRAEGGSNTLYIDDRAQKFATTYTLNGDDFQAEGSAPILFADVHTLLIWGGQGQSTGLFSPVGNTFNVLDTAPAPTYTTLFPGDRGSVNVHGTTGTLFVNFAAGDLASVNIGGPEKGLDPIQKEVWVSGGMGMNVNVDDSGSTAPQTVTIDQDLLSRSGAAAIHYLYADNLPLSFLGGSGGNTINVLGKRGNLTLLSGTGKDTITIGSAAGTLSNLGHFIINGQGGNDALYLLDQGETADQTYDFSSISNLPYFSDIPVFTCTGTTIVLAQIDANAVTASPMTTVALLGGSGSNTINVDGSWATSKLAIDAGPGNDVINGGAGRELLIGGAGVDVLNSGSEEAILVAGSVAFGDTPAELAALTAIMAEWGRTDLDYATRVDHLLHGGGMNGTTLLNPDTYIADAGGNIMTAAGLDLFFGSQARDTSNWDPASGAVFVDPDTYTVSITFNIVAMPGNTLFLDGNAVDASQVINLSPGQHVLSTNRGVSAFFSVAAAGTIDYDPVLEGAFSGRGTGTLEVQIAILDPAQASQFLITCPPNTEAGSAVNVTVSAMGDFGNLATGYTGTVHVTSSDGSFSPFDYSFTDADQGQHNFALTLTAAGSQSVTVADNANNSIIGNVGVTVSPAAASKVVVSAPTTGMAGQPISVMVSAFDAYGNLATGYSGTIHFTSNDAKAILPADAGLSNGTGSFKVTFNTAGKEAVTVTDVATGSITASTGVTVSAAVAKLVVSAPITSIAGQPLTLTVTAFDTTGKVAGGYLGTVHVTSTDRSVQPLDYTFTATDLGVHKFSLSLNTAGKQTLTVAAPGLSSVSAGVTVSPAAKAKLAFGTTTPTKTVAGAAISPAISVLVEDQFGNVVTSDSTDVIKLTSSNGPLKGTVSVKVSAGIATFTGLSLTQSGTTVITALATGLANAGTTFTVTPASASRFVLTGLPSTVLAGQTYNVIVTVQDAFGNAVPNYLTTVHFSSSDLKATLPTNSTFQGSSQTFSVVFRTKGTQTLKVADSTAKVIGNLTITVQ